MTAVPMIFEKLRLASQDIGPIEKDRQFGDPGGRGPKYKFRGIDDVLDAANPAFIDHGIITTPEVLRERREERTTSTGTVMVHTIIRVRTTFHCAADGSSTSCVTIGEGADTSDKSSGKAMSVAHKYAVILTLNIPVKGMPQVEDHDHQFQPRETAVAAKVANDSVSAFWSASRAAGQSKQEGAAFLKSHGGDFAKATAALAEK